MKTIVGGKKKDMNFPQTSGENPEMRSENILARQIITLSKSICIQ